MAQWDLIYQHLIQPWIFEEAGPLLAPAERREKPMRGQLRNPRQSFQYLRGRIPSRIAIRPPARKCSRSINLGPLAKAGVRILHVCGSEDPWLEKNSLPAEKKYRELGGEMKVVIEPGKDHLSTAPVQPEEVVDFIMN